MSELCARLNIKLEFVNDTFRLIVPSDSEIQLALVDTKCVYSTIKKSGIEKDLIYWQNLKSQGRLCREAAPYSDPVVSNEHLRNIELNDALVKFVCKARLQLLETQSLLSIYYPQKYNNTCPMCGFTPDTASHILSSCQAFRGMYIERHDRSVDHIYDQINNHRLHLNSTVVRNKLVTPQMLNVEQFDNHVLNKPDIFVYDTETKEAFIIEISHPFDAFIQVCYQHKFDKYMPLCLEIQSKGYKCTIIVLIIGSLGFVHKRYISGLCKIGFNSHSAKAISKFLSVSSMIGSRRVWTRRRRR